MCWIDTRLTYPRLLKLTMFVSRTCASFPSIQLRCVQEELCLMSGWVQIAVSNGISSSDGRNRTSDGQAALRNRRNPGA